MLIGPSSRSRVMLLWLPFMLSPARWKRSLPTDGRFRSDGRGQLQLLSQARPAPAARCCVRWKCSAARSWRVIARSKRCYLIQPWPILIRRARKSIPPDQRSFLKAYESREQEMIDFLK